MALAEACARRVVMWSERGIERARGRAGAALAGWDVEQAPEHSVRRCLRAAASLPTLSECPRADARARSRFTR